MPNFWDNDPVTFWEQDSIAEPQQEDESVPLKLWDATKGAIQIPWNMAIAGLGSEAAGAVAGLYDYYRSSGDPKALESARKYVRDEVAKTLKMEQSQVGGAVEQKIGEGFEWLKKKGGELGQEYLGPGGQHIGEAVVEAAPFAIPGVIAGARGIAKAPIKLRESMSAARAPTIGGKPTSQYYLEQYGPDVPSPVTPVSKPGISQRIAKWSEDSTPPPPVSPIVPEPSRGGPLASYDISPLREPPPRTPGRYNKSAFDLINNIDTQLLKVLGGDMSNPIYARWRSMEAALPIKRAEYDPILMDMGKVVKKMSSNEHLKFKNAMLAEDTMKARQIFAESANYHKVKLKEAPEVLFDKVRPALDTRFKELASVYDDIKYRENFVPRRINDLAGLKKQLAIDAKKPELQYADKILASIEKLEQQFNSGKLDQYQFQTELGKTLLQGVSRDIRTPITGHAKERQLSLDTPEALRRYEKYYSEPLESLGRYFDETATNVIERKFLGKGKPQEAISSFMTEAVKGGALSPTQALDIAKLMEVRFSPTAMENPGRMLSALRDSGYMGTIGNPLSASIQLFDILPSAAKYGMWNTLKAMAKTLAPSSWSKNKIIKPGDVGLRNIAHDIVTESGLKGRHFVLHKVMQLSGFRAMDQFSKATIMETALNRFASKAKSKNGDAWLTKRGFREYYKTDYEWQSFKEALASKNIKDPRVQEAMVAELLDIQPHSITSMPISFTKHPKGRILYMLKTWAIRQLNAVRSEALKGNYGMAAKLGLYIYMSNMAAPMLRDAISSLYSKEPIEKTWDDRMVEAFYRSLMMDRVASTQALQGRWGPLLSSLLDIPPIGMGEAVVGDISNWIQGKHKPIKTFEYTPLVGPYIRQQNKEKQ